MELENAKELAINLMHKHSLIDKGWQFIFNNAKTRLGRCSSKRKTISLSKNFLPIVSEEETIDTVLHEIAHAIVGVKHGHNHIWRQKAIEIGCNGNRLYHGEAKIEPKYIGTCPTCGRVIKRHRRTRISCGKCGKGVFNSKHLFIWSVK